MKHGVDKHNLTWNYAPSEINVQVHRLAINLVIFSVVMLQLFQSVILFMMGNTTDQQTSKDFSQDLKTYLSLALLAITLFIFPTQIFPDCCRKMSPIQ